MIYVLRHVFEIAEAPLKRIGLRAVSDEPMGPYRTGVFSPGIAAAYRETVLKDINYVTKKVFNEGYYIKTSTMETLENLSKYYEFKDQIAWFERYRQYLKDTSFACQLRLEAKNRPNIEDENRLAIKDFKTEMLMSDIGQELIDAKISYISQTNTNLSSQIKKLESGFQQMEDKDYEGWLIKMSKEFSNYNSIVKKYRSNKISIAYLQGKYDNDKTIITDDMIHSAKKVKFNKLLKLEVVGSRERCLCPFHNEKTPSFYIYPDTNRGYCHGCGRSVDTIQYLVEIEKMDFNQAVLTLLTY